MEEFLARKKPAYIINAAINASGCWMVVYWTHKSDYTVAASDTMKANRTMMMRVKDFQSDLSGSIRSTAFGRGRNTIFLRASNGDHEWSFRWKDLPDECEMMIQVK